MRGHLFTAAKMILAASQQLASADRCSITHSSVLARRSMNYATFYTEKAGHCRLLAAAITDNCAVEALSEMAEECESLAAKANPYLMHDPRRPDTLAWLEAVLPLEERLALMVAMACAFPLIENDRRWQAHIDAIRAELHPGAEEHGDIMLKAGRISRRLRAELAASAQPQR